VAAVEVPGGGARDRLGMPVANRRPYLVMDGPAVFQRAVREMTDSSRRVLARAEWDAASVGRFVPHQANVRIMHGVAERLGIAADRVVANIEDVGNTVAASIPLALADGHDTGRLTAGQRVLLTSIGAGLAWGSAVLTWPALQGKARV
jgi:3-oxoacyl-[acyl-carrier-protein] synthase-3